MQPSDLQVELMQEFDADQETRTPETLANRVGVTLAEVREAEKTALRKLADPGHVNAAALDRIDLTPLERDVILYLYCAQRRRTPEDIAREFGVPLATVLEAKKAALRECQDRPSPPDDAA